MSEFSKVPVDPYLTLKDIRAITQVNPSTIYRWIEAGTFPRGKQLGANCVRWRASDIQAWQEGHQDAA